MTGFATHEITLTVDDIKVTVAMNLKSLNSRYFEAHIKTPQQLTNLETKITKHLKNKLHRGKIYCTVFVDNDEAFKSEINASMPVIKKYLQAIDEMQKEFSVAGSISISDLINLPHVFHVEEKSLDNNAETSIIKAVEELADKVIVVQKEEGNSILNDLNNRIEIIKQEIDKVGKLSKENLDSHKADFEKNLGAIDNQELAETKQAILYQLLDKIDIHEETVLFNSYLKQLCNIISDETVEKGKRINFTLQELNREVNTISAKCSDTSIGKHSIIIKVELEKMREQAQNIL